METHHLNSWFYAPSQRYEVINGVLLTQKLHQEFHSIYGDPTTVSQFEEFCRAKGIYEFPWKNRIEEILEIQTYVRSRRPTFTVKMMELINRKGYVYVDGTYENKFSKFVIFCPEHDIEFVSSYNSFSRSDFGCPECSYLHNRRQSSLPPSQKGLIRSQETKNKKKATVSNQKQEKITQLAARHQHQIVSGAFESTKTKYDIKCNIHQKTYLISYYNYMRNVYGLPCCREAFARNTNGQPKQL